MGGEFPAKNVAIIIGAAAIVAAIVFAWRTGRGVSVELPGTVKIKLDEKSKPVAGEIATVAGKNVPASASQEGHLSVPVPGREAIPFEAIDEVYVEAPDDDPQLRHQELVVKMFQSGEQQRLFKESDDDGMFSTWITVGAIHEGKRCLNYTTLYERWTNHKEVAFRLACPTETGWEWQIDPAFKAVIERYRQ